ncbi:MAG TPA: Fic family protein [Kribbella sp.]
MPDSADEIDRQLRANDDPYLDPRWGVLANKVGARTRQELADAENDLVEVRALELAAKPVKPTFDENHLRAIHRRLFGDVYEWAGERRTVNTRKADDQSAPFFPAQRFQVGVPGTFEQIAERNFRPGMPMDEFVNKLTRTYDEVNHLHLFREGNGRSQRIFLSQLAAHAGYSIDWDAVHGDRNDVVCRAAGHGDREPMKAMLAEIVHPAEQPHPAAADRASRTPKVERAAAPARQRLSDRAHAYVARTDRAANERAQAAKADPPSIGRQVDGDQLGQ